MVFVLSRGGGHFPIYRLPLLSTDRSSSSFKGSVMSSKLLFTSLIARKAALSSSASSASSRVARHGPEDRALGRGDRHQEHPLQLLWLQLLWLQLLWPLLPNRGDVRCGDASVPSSLRTSALLWSVSVRWRPVQR